jgi:hypothetical protein
MNARLVTLLLSVSLLCAVAPSGLSFADEYRYMDASGNIFFVDSINQVPPRYREQVIPPTPVPVYDKKTQALVLRMKREADAKRIRAEKERQREELRQKRLKEKEAKEREREAKRREKEERRERRIRPTAMRGDEK